MWAPDPNRHTIVIVGAGFSGTAVAYRLLQAGDWGGRVVLVERSGRFGPGLAYGGMHHKTFSPSGQMTVARSFHTATLLRSGKVLITGGLTPAGRTSSSELFDPVSGTFAPTGGMILPRDAHTATRLGNDTVLIVGGFAVPGPAAEIDDPVTGVFAPTGGSTPTDRPFHAAALLQNGNVLIAGGGAANNTVEWASVYDPVTGTFREVGPMSAKRTFDGTNAATLLTDGMVLVAGQPRLQSVSIEELYDPVTEAFVVTGRMKNLTAASTATRLPDGNVLVTGVDGARAQRPAGAELYVATNGSFMDVGSLRVQRTNGYTATRLLNGKVLLVGGWLFSSNSVTASAELSE